MLSSFDSLKQNGWNYVQKIMRQRGYVVLTSLDVHLNYLESVPLVLRFVSTGKNCARSFKYGTMAQDNRQPTIIKTSGTSVRT